MHRPALSLAAFVSVEEVCEVRHRLPQADGKVKVGKKAGIVLGVIAIAAIGAVGIHSIAAGVSTDIELDPKFDLGLGVAGIAVGISAIYVAGLTATTGAACAATGLATLPARKPIVAPYATIGWWRCRRRDDVLSSPQQSARARPERGRDRAAERAPGTFSRAVAGTFSRERVRSRGQPSAAHWAFSAEAGV